MVRYSVIDSPRIRISVRKERLTKCENLLLGTQKRVRINGCPYKASSVLEKINYRRFPSGQTKLFQCSTFP